MNVKQLRELIADLPNDMPVAVEVTFDDGDGFEGAGLKNVNVETRCDDVERLYLWGEQVQLDEDEDEENASSEAKLVVT
jgi:hypothetical protein